MALPLAFDDDHTPLYTIGQVAGMLNVQQAFLRRLESEEVMQPARSQGGQRRYTRQEVHDVERIVALTDEGMTLAGIRRILVLESQILDLKRQISELQQH